MLGLKTFWNAEVTLSEIELSNKIKKGQFDTSEGAGPGIMVLHVREEALAAQGEIENRPSPPPSKKWSRFKALTVSSLVNLQGLNDKKRSRREYQNCYRTGADFNITNLPTEPLGNPKQRHYSTVPNWKSEATALPYPH
jgi:hypothetical protein